MATKTSIKIKKFWHAVQAADGDVGTLWKEIQVGTREATMQFNGSEADVTNYPNIVGDNLESSNIKGDKTLNFQFADLTPEEIAPFVGGTVTDGVDSVKYESPENENVSIELSLMFMTEKNVLFTIPRASLDAYPMVNDDDLHYYQINSVVLKPNKTGVATYQYDVLKDAALVKNDITGFSFGALDEAAFTIDAGAHTVVGEVVNGTDLTALSPEVLVSLGASVEDNSGDEVDFSAPVTYTVKAPDGTEQAWTVTVTAAA